MTSEFVFCSVHVKVLWEILRGKYPIILRMREQSVAGLLSPPKEACEGG